MRLKTSESTPQLSTASKEYSSEIAERTQVNSTKLSCKWPRSSMKLLSLNSPGMMSLMRKQCPVQSGNSLRVPLLWLIALSGKQLRNGFSINKLRKQPGTMANTLLSLSQEWSIPPAILHPGSAYTIEPHSRINLEPLEHKQLNRLIV